MTIPWTALLNSPVKVLIDGVNLQVGPLNIAVLDKEETRKRVLSAKMQKLRMVDKFIDYPSGDGIEDMEYGQSDEGDEEKTKQIAPNVRATYMQQWTSKIIDNLEITLKNVHLRYEDSQTIPRSPFSAGITLNSFTLSTCDEKWHEKFVARDVNKASLSIWKMAKVYNFGIYWQTKSIVLAKETFSDWSIKMKALIYPGIGTTEKSVFTDIQYILNPANNLIIKLTHNGRTVENLPKFDMVVESTNLPLSIDRAQYLQVLQTLVMIGMTEKKRQPHMYRPSERPVTPEGARAWWRYACKMVVRRSKYIQLVKLSHTLDPTSGHMDIRAMEQKREAQELEERMPLRSLIIFRYAAAREMQEEAQNRYKQLELQLEPSVKSVSASVKQSPAAGRTWMGWIAGLEVGDSGTVEDSIKSKEDTTNTFHTGEETIESEDTRVTPTTTQNNNAGTSSAKGQLKSGSASKTTGDRDGGVSRQKKLEEEDVSIESIISSLEKEQEEVSDISGSSVLFRASLTTSASLDVAVGGAPVATATMALTVLAEVTTWGISATVEMRDLLVIDKCTVTPAIKNIIAVKHTNTPQSSSPIVMTEEEGASDGKDSPPPTPEAPAHDSGPNVVVVYEYLNGRKVIRITALPVEIAVNKLCVQQLVGLFLPPATAANTTTTTNAMPSRHPISSIASRPVKKVRMSVSPKKPKTSDQRPLNFYIDGVHSDSDNTENIDFKFRVDDSDHVEEEKFDEEDDGGGEEGDIKGNDLEDKGDYNNEYNKLDREGALEIIFEADAPKIIVPQDSSSDMGYLLLDMGYLKVRKFILYCS